MNQAVRNSRIEEVAKPAWALETKLYVPVRDKEIVFGFPAFGPNTYAEAVKQVLGNGQRLPTGEQTAFMLDEAYNSNVPEVKNSARAKSVRTNIMRNGWLWVPQVNVWTPKTANSGMYSVYDKEGNGLGKVIDTNELEDRLSGGSIERGVRFSQDRSVAFAPLNTIRAGTHNKGTLAQDGAYIANYGVEGAEKIDKVASGFNFNPYSWIVDNNSGNNIQSLSALLRIWLLDGDRLLAGFDSYGGGRLGYVVSVSGSDSSAEGTAPKK